MDLTRLLAAIANLDHKAAVDLLNATPSLATARLALRDEFFLAERLAQVYEGGTALHAAGFSYDPGMARPGSRHGHGPGFKSYAVRAVVSSPARRWR